MRGKAWSLAQLDLLRSLWPTAELEEIYAALAPHPPLSIERKAAAMLLRRRRTDRESRFGVIADLWKLREKMKMTRAQLADKMGVHKLMLGRWERGDANPSVGWLHAWCTALDVELSCRPKAHATFSVASTQARTLPAGPVSPISKERLMSKNAYSRTTA